MIEYILALLIQLLTIILMFANIVTGAEWLVEYLHTNRRKHLYLAMLGFTSATWMMLAILLIFYVAKR